MSLSLPKRWKNLLAITLGVMLLGYGTLAFAGAVRTNHHYDHLHQQLVTRMTMGIEPRAMTVMIKSLGVYRQNARDLLAHGLFAAAGGLTLVALGSRRWLYGRPAERERVRVATDVAVQRGLRVAPSEADEAREQALLARFALLELQAAREQARPRRSLGA